MMFFIIIVTHLVYAMYYQNQRDCCLQIAAEDAPVRFTLNKVPCDGTYSILPVS